MLKVTQWAAKPGTQSSDSCPVCIALLFSHENPVTPEENRALCRLEENADSLLSLLLIYHTTSSGSSHELGSSDDKFRQHSAHSSCRGACFISPGMSCWEKGEVLLLFSPHLPPTALSHIHSFNKPAQECLRRARTLALLQMLQGCQHPAASTLLSGIHELLG